MCEPDYLVEGHKSQEAPLLETYDPHPSPTIESPLGTGATTEERTRILQVMFTNAFKGIKKKHAPLLQNSFTYVYLFT